MGKVKKAKYEKVDLSDYGSYWSPNGYSLEHFQLMTYKGEKVVIYGGGHWEGHIMDWLGLNMYHGRLPKSPVFDSTKEALDWLKFQIQEGVYREGMILRGHHSGEYECSMGCDEREIGRGWIGFNELKEKEKKHGSN